MLDPLVRHIWRCLEGRVASPCAIQSVIHSTGCSFDTTMLLSTDGLSGPVTVNRLGKSAIAPPR
jgi:hypothetical protein